MEGGIISSSAASGTRQGGSHKTSKRDEVIKRLVPGVALPLALAALPSAFERIENAFGIVDLVDGGRALGAVAPATARVIGVALKALHAPALFIDVGHQAARRLAVEADGGDNLIVLFDFARPCLRIVFNPVAPLLRRRA